MKKVLSMATVILLTLLLTQIGTADVTPGSVSHEADVDVVAASDGSESGSDMYQEISAFVDMMASEILPSSGPQFAPMTTGCVEVDIELPALVEFEPGGEPPIATGYFELVSCGDEAAEITLDLELIIEVGDFVDTFSIGGIPVMMAAGEVISRDLTFGVPPFDGSYSVCVTAASGDAVDEDCATMVVEGLGGFAPNAPGTQVSDRPGDLMSDYGDGAEASDVENAIAEFTNELFAQILGQPLATTTTECVEVDIELPETIFVEEGLPQGTGYFELINCGDEAAEIMLQLEATIVIEGFIDTTFTFPAVPVMMGAGEVISHEFMFVAPPFDGSYTFCITATSGAAEDVDCATMDVVGGDWPDPPGGAPATGITARNYPNPFNPVTNIEVYLPSDAHLKLEVYNVLGQVVRVLADDHFGAGEHEIQWNGTDGNGNRAASGIYFYRIQSGSFSLIKKMLLLK